MYLVTSHHYWEHFNASETLFLDINTSPLCLNLLELNLSPYESDFEQMVQTCLKMTYYL